MGFLNFNWGWYRTVTERELQTDLILDSPMSPIGRIRVTEELLSYNKILESSIKVCFLMIEAIEVIEKVNFKYEVSRRITAI